ncbi:exonuclease V [Mycena amicta]|nr:exonuclease V [Mycena amicta]
MAMSDGDYDAYDEFTALDDDDFALLDAACVQAMAIDMDTAAMPSIAIEIEGGQGQATLSPMARYRQRGTLSVTDLISLAWCEVQFDYGLQQRRSRRLVDRPRSFRSEHTGKEIVVQQDVAARNDKTTKRGRFIHKELELELIKPDAEEIQLTITSEEEYWALRILNSLSSLVSLGAEHCARETPVFGIVDGIAVVGIIDELQINPPSNHGDSSCDAVLMQTIHVIDTKTRRTESLPADEDTEPTKLQLMLYHRLLANLLHPSTPFDYPRFWHLLGLDPTKPFSLVFMEQMKYILGRTDSDAIPLCLQDLAAFVDLRVAEMQLPPLDHNLTVIYRSQNKYSAPLQPRRTDTMVMETEEQELARAILMSLTSEEESLRIEFFRSELQKALQECVPAPGESPPEPRSPKTSAIIGTKSFPLDEPALDAYLHSSVQWWTGRRKARGVAERQTRRCFSCEYFNDCEWREQKAAEKLAEVQRRREAQAR